MNPTLALSADICECNFILSKDRKTSPLVKSGHKFPIVICEYDTAWIQIYENEQKAISKCFSKSDIVQIDHIGSTAVPGLKAKPTIDILLQISETVGVETMLNVFDKLGYRYSIQQDNPPPHLFFTKGYDDDVLTETTIHVHVRFVGNWPELYFRDYLREHRPVAKEYEKLKLQLASVYKTDREAYCNGKSTFISMVMATRESK